MPGRGSTGRFGGPRLCRAVAESFVKKIARNHPALARYLENAIRTGVVCRYSPESPVKWN